MPFTPDEEAAIEKILIDLAKIGTPAKGGEVKVYFDPADPVDAEKRIREAFRLRALARALAEGQEVHA